MQSENNTDNLLIALSAALYDSGLKQASVMVTGLPGRPLLEIMDSLSLLERTVNNAQAHRAIAMCKQAITGKTDSKAFIEHCRKLQGMR